MNSGQILSKNGTTEDKRAGNILEITEEKVPKIHALI